MGNGHAMLTREPTTGRMEPDARARACRSCDQPLTRVILDLGMPGMDGWEVARRLKADPETADIPIIALTAFALRGDEERARGAGCDGYLAKPCRPQTIREAVRHFLGAR